MSPIERYLPPGHPFTVTINNLPFGLIWADDAALAIEQARQAFKRERGRPPFSVLAEPFQTGEQP